MRVPLRLVGNEVTPGKGYPDQDERASTTLKDGGKGPHRLAESFWIVARSARYVIGLRCLGQKRPECRNVQPSVARATAGGHEPRDRIAEAGEDATGHQWSEA